MTFHFDFETFYAYRPYGQEQNYTFKRVTRPKNRVVRPAYRTRVHRTIADRRFRFSVKTFTFARHSSSVCLIISWRNAHRDRDPTDDGRSTRARRRRRSVETVSTYTGSHGHVIGFSSYEVPLSTIRYNNNNNNNNDNNIVVYLYTRVSYAAVHCFVRFSTPSASF